MGNPKDVYKCSYRLRDGTECRKPDAQPQFTKPLREARDEPQPRWFCKEHASRFASYGPISGDLLKAPRR